MFLVPPPLRTLTTATCNLFSPSSAYPFGFFHNMDGPVQFHIYKKSYTEDDKRRCS